MNIAHVEKAITLHSAVLNRDPDIKNIIDAHLNRHFGSHERADEFLDLVEDMDGEQFWTILHSQWSGFDAIDHFRMEQVINAFGCDWSVEYLDEVDRAFYDTLPEMVTIYRGQSAQSMLGLAWTTDYEVAKGFALGHRGYCCPDPVIIKGTIAKRDVAGAYANREESEILLFNTNDAEVIERIEIPPRDATSAT